jgi:tetratricopeptide (TPR) repeat protein
VLNLFEHVFLSRNLTRNEQERLADAVEDQSIRERIRTVGLGEYVGAAGQVADALKLGAAGMNALGYALVLAAADWRRCGMIRPITTSMLTSLAKPHLEQRDQVRLADPDALATGLAWATRDINLNVQLLRPAGTDCYVVYDYALDLISAQDTPIPDSSWAAIMANADPPELVGIGYTAEVIYHRGDTAIQAWRKAADSGHTDMASKAAFNLGVVLANQGDVQGAKDAYQKAIDSGHADMAPTAAANLGLLLADQGDVQGAKDAYQKAIDSGHADMAPAAAANLGGLLKDQGDVQGAKDAYQKAIDSGHADMAPAAAFNLGVMLADQGDVQGAKDAYQKAIDSGHADQAPTAARNLERLLKGQGDANNAKPSGRGT